MAAIYEIKKKTLCYRKEAQKTAAKEWESPSKTVHVLVDCVIICLSLYTSRTCAITLNGNHLIYIGRA